MRARRGRVQDTSVARTQRNQRCKREHGCDRKQSHRHGSLLVDVAHRSAAEEPSVGQDLGQHVGTGSRGKRRSRRRPNPDR